MRATRVIFAIFCFAQFMFSVPAEEVRLPDTPAGRKMAQLLAVIQSGDESARKSFVQQFDQSFRDRFSEQEHLQVLSEMQERTGGLEVKQILNSQPAQLVIIAKAIKTKRLLRVKLSTQATEPFGITEIGIVPAEDDESQGQAGEEKSTAAVSNEDARKGLTELFEKLKPYGFTGGVLVAKNGEVIFEQGYGFADKMRNRLVTNQTVFDIGSNTKDFTHAAILQLVAKKQLQLHDSLSKFFPNVPADKAGITIAQLLNHTAGFPMYSGKDEEFLEREDFLKRIFSMPLKSRPGVQESYSNPGYSILAAIIEKLSGQSYEEYLKQNIFRPAGMNHTGYALLKINPDEIAHTYAGNKDRGSTLDFRHPPDGPSWNLRGNGGMLSTLRDMYAFYEALVQGNLLPKDSGLHVFPPDEPVGLAGSDGFHFFLYERRPGIGVSVLIATTNADLKAPVVMRPILAILQGNAWKLPSDLKSD